MHVIWQSIQEKAHRHWEDIYENGCFAPSWPDGTNLNLVRNHMLYYQRKIEERYGESEKPSITYESVSDKVEQDYMARKDEIIQRAAEFYVECSKMQEVQYLLLEADYLSEKDISCLNIMIDIHRCKSLGKAIVNNDYVTMRNLSWNLSRKTNILVVDRNTMTLRGSYFYDPELEHFYDLKTHQEVCINRIRRLYFVSDIIRQTMICYDGDQASLIPVLDDGWLPGMNRKWIDNCNVLNDRIHACFSFF